MKKHGTVVSGGALVVASVLAFQGCMPDTLVLGNTRALRMKVPRMRFVAPTQRPAPSFRPR